MPSDPNTPNDGPNGQPAPGGSGQAGGRAVSARLDLLESRLGEVEKRLGMSGPASEPLPTGPAAPAALPAGPDRVENLPTHGVPVQDAGREGQTPTAVEAKRAIVRQMFGEERSLATNAPGSGEPTKAPAAADDRRGSLAAPSGSPKADPESEQPSVSGSEAAPALRAAQAARRGKPERPALTLEQFIGGKSFLVLGALIVVIGAGFFLKLAVDEGWIGRIPPLARCLAAAAFGAGLLVVGELAVKRLGRFAAVGFRAAGLGVLYATSYAAYGAFELVSAPGAFLLLVAVCGLGVGIALRGRSVMLAVLSLVGGYAAPLIAASQAPPAWALPAHLLALLVIGSVIAVRVPYQRVLATLTWWGTALLGTVWVTAALGDDPGLVIAFAGLVWGIVHWTRISLPPTTRKHPVWAGMPGAASFSTTVWSVGAMVLAADEIVGMRAWHATGIGLVATLGLALYVGRGWRSLLGRPRGQRGVIGASLLGQAAPLLPLTLLLVIEPRWGELLVFVLLGTAAFGVGRRVEAWAMIAYGTALLTLGTLRVLAVPLDAIVQGSGIDSMYSRGTLVGGWFVSPWMWLMLLAAGAWMTCGWLSSGWMIDADRDGFSIRWPRFVCVTVACVLLPVAFLHGETDGWALACCWFGLAAAALAVSRVIRRPLSAMPVLGYLAITTMLTLSLPSMDDASYANGRPMGGLVLSWWMVMVGVVGISWLVCAWRCLRPVAESEAERGSPAWIKDLRSLCLVIGCVVLPVAFLHGDATSAGVMAGWFGLTLAAFGVSGAVRHRWAAAPSGVYLSLVTVLWFAAFLANGWMGGRGAVPLFLHPGLIWSVVIAVAWGVCAWMAGRSAVKPVRDAGVIGWWIGGVLLLISTTLEVARFAGAVTDDPTAHAGSVSIWWAVVAVGLLAGGFARAVAPLRYAGIGLLLVATGKVLTYDLAELSPVVRVGSFIGLGLVLLCVAAWYLRAVPGRAKNAEEAAGKGGVH